MGKINPWDRAVECERALTLTVDRDRRILLTKLREAWIALGNEWRAGLDSSKKVQGIARIHDATIRQRDLTLH
jgi:hypothetical protein